MSLASFFTETIAVSRKQWTGNKSADTSAGSVSGHIQQASPDQQKYLSEVNGLAHAIWCDIDADIYRGDTLTVSSGYYSGTYSVKSVQVNGQGANLHKEIIAVMDHQVAPAVSDSYLLLADGESIFLLADDSSRLVLA
jgi:hypothetical protein